MAPKQPEDVTEDNHKWLTSAAIQQGDHREQFLVELGDHLDAQGLSNRAELAQTLTEVAKDPARSLDEADLGRIVEIAEAHGFDAHAWIARREHDLHTLARAYNREQVARQALKNMDSYLG